MKALLKGFALMAFAGFVASSAVAAERGTAEEASALVKKAVAAINYPKGQFVDRDLYIFVYDMKGNNVAIGNGNASKMNGKNMLEMRDADGKYIIKGFIDILNTKNSGWFDYKWPNPVTKAVEAKSSYVEKVDDLIVGSGIYKQ